MDEDWGWKESEKPSFPALVGGEALKPHREDPANYRFEDPTKAPGHTQVMPGCRLIVPGGYDG